MGMTLQLRSEFEHVVVHSWTPRIGGCDGSLRQPSVVEHSDVIRACCRAFFDSENRRHDGRWVAALSFRCIKREWDSCFHISDGEHSASPSASRHRPMRSRSSVGSDGVSPALDLSRCLHVTRRAAKTRRARREDITQRVALLIQAGVAWPGLRQLRHLGDSSRSGGQSRSRAATFAVISRSPDAGRVAPPPQQRQADLEPNRAAIGCANHTTRSPPRSFDALAQRCPHSPAASSIPCIASRDSGRLRGTRCFRCAERAVLPWSSRPQGVPAIPLCLQAHELLAFPAFSRHASAPNAPRATPSRPAAGPEVS